ncbi:MAG: D-alanine--D-alanine ligase [Phyllobacteriaceae bacterium]|nr:D-alanine--D-alanine ligase [Phyllobacteriaceae bacterium]
MSDARETSKLRIAVLFGGRSTEHEVSIMSATNVVRALDPAKYDVVPIFVTRAGRWLESRFADDVLALPTSGTELAPLPGGGGRTVAISPDGGFGEGPRFDLLFPVLHGLDGEDGSVQGLAAVSGVALVGCGILGSATALDKDVAKRLLTQAGLPTARSVTVRRGAVPEFDAVVAKLGLPIFVKPARQGSSVGVAKVADAAGWSAAVTAGFRYDDKLVVEEFVAGREIECAVLEDLGGALFVSRPGEIAPAASHGFYTYEAKYVDADGAVLMVPADLPAEVEAEVRDVAAKAFWAVGCDGMARVDVFVTADRRILVNELNTIPGFTDISMYPKAMAASGLVTGELLDRLIAHGLGRAATTH